ncbi:MAG: trypsin-like peptidase domain-containing protein [Candidatus Dormibacteraeota bacterium]|uniref:Trypsin-like peptidase domain-containing protein n=1 Tax=Candidatus Amunia macphersoniae TaxID=3127014 RepID=A0A934KGC9_9BACT|nr:trypsin-like peptidase domain-containing protein [Candidatus Dormibacteraeota bacterium]
MSWNNPDPTMPALATDPTTPASAADPPPPPVTSPAPSRRGRIAILVAALLLLAGVGLAGGLLGANLANRTTSSSSHASTAPSLAVDPQPLAVTAQGDAAAVAAKLSPSVGTIVVASSGGSALGSGFVISNSGGTSYLLTNNHVVSGATSVEVVMPSDRTYTGTVVGADKFDDLAVVSIADGKLPVATFGDSDKLAAGQRVIAIGSPLGNVGSVTTGVISALHRTIQAGDQTSGTQETLQDVLQTDASINPGNSGGPLADSAGRVVGVNVAASGQGANIGFSIPSNIARRIATDLINHQPIVTPFIGVGYTDPVNAASKGEPYTQPGLRITTVAAGSPAAGAGVQVGDVLTSVDGRALTNGQTLGGIIQSHAVGDTLTLVVLRSNQSVTLHVTLAARPASAG